MVTWSVTFGEAEHHGVEHMVEQSCSPRGIQEVERGTVGVPISPSRTHLNDLPLAPPPKGSPTFQQYHRLAAKPLTHEPLGDSPDSY
jgi:hypothetical protein